MKTPPDKIRLSLHRLMDERGVDMATVSRSIGKNHAYIQQFLTRGVPAELGYKTALALAAYFECDAKVFGISLPPPKTTGQKPPALTREETAMLTRLRALTPVQRHAVDSFVSSFENTSFKNAPFKNEGA